MEWKPWLTRWSKEWINAALPDEIDADVMRDRWLGFAPATMDQIVAAEKRLGVRLPPSYRDFLRTTNGWRSAGTFVYRLRDTETLGWLREIDPSWEDWEVSWEDWDEVAPNGPADPVDDSLFTRGLMLSLEADSGILFLDPADTDEHGEWAAYSFFSWRAEPPTRFASFSELMDELYDEFHTHRKPAES